jgi:hypothetical protein
VIETIGEALANVVHVTPDPTGVRGELIFPPVFQGFPNATHGGGMVAAFDRVAKQCAREQEGPRRLATKILRTVPLETQLSLTAAHHDSEVNVTLSHGTEPVAHATARNGGGMADGGDFSRWAQRSGPHWGAPITRGCLACGSENPIGCQLRLSFDDRWLWSEYQARPPYRSADGILDPALFPIVLDEIGWWLGAIRTGEAGVTVEVETTVYGDEVAFDEPLVFLGEHAAATAADAKGHFWRAAGGIFTRSGRLLASTTVIYAASRIYSKRLIPALLTLNPPESVRRIFPRYVS